MPTRDRNTHRTDKGYSLIEMLIVCALIVILATMPIALVRRSREKIHEADALRALRMMALAYENYWAQNGHMYPNFRSDGQMADDIKYKNAEEIWDDLTGMGLVPGQYSGYPHDRRDLLARGYRLSIFPADYGAMTGGGARNTYAIGLIPYPDSVATRGLVIIRGQRFFSNYPSPVPYKMRGMGLYSIDIYSFAD